MFRGLRSFCVLLVLLVVLVAALPAWRHFYPVVAAQGWSYRVYRDSVERVSALAQDAAGRLYISQEFRNGKGTVLRIDKDGLLTVLKTGLFKPDGLVYFLDGVVYGQEEGRHPVYWTDGRSERALFHAHGVEGVATDGTYLYAIEDLHGNGRLLRYEPHSQSVTVLRSGLDEAEALAVCPDGRILYSEKELGHIKQWRAGATDLTVISGLNAPGYVLCNREGVWITEDATHMARLLLLDPQGRLHEVLTHLRSGQTIMSLADGHYLLAEQGRNRILEVQRSPAES